MVKLGKLVIIFVSDYVKPERKCVMSYILHYSTGRISSQSELMAMSHQGISAITEEKNSYKQIPKCQKLILDVFSEVPLKRILPFLPPYRPKSWHVQ